MNHTYSPKCANIAITIVSVQKSIKSTLMEATVNQSDHHVYIQLCGYGMRDSEHLHEA